MNKAIAFLYILCSIPRFLTAQITPREGQALNYRIVGFSFPEEQHAVSYRIEIATGNYTNEDSFQKHILVTTSAKAPRMIAEVPAFGKQYTWRSVSTDEHSKAVTSGLHHFSTLMVADVNTDSVRLRIMDSATKYKDDYVFIDGHRVLYDMQGHPVWFFPAIDTFTRQSMHLRDLKASTAGTITAIISERIFEINYNGEVLWERPGKNKITIDSVDFEVYHHDFTRLKNGHYMSMAFEQAWWQLPGPVDSNTLAQPGANVKRDKNNAYSQKTVFGTLVEYDRQGNVVWRWHSSDYFKKSDMYGRMTGNGLFNLNDTHANSFYFDEQKKIICIGFRGINRIIKIQYPSGKVLSTYGKLYDPASGGNPHLLNNAFCLQHSSGLTDEGNVYLYNNNACHRKGAPTVVVLKEPKSEKDTLEKLWEFECPVDEPEKNASTKIVFFFGGNVIELPDKSFLVCMGGIFGKTFIVNRDKKILWSAQPEKWEPTKGEWTKRGVMLDGGNTEGIYRANIVTRAQLESLVWGVSRKS